MDNMEVLFFNKDNNLIYIKNDYGYQNVTYEVMEAWLRMFNVDPANIYRMIAKLEKDAVPEKFI